MAHGFIFMMINYKDDPFQFEFDPGKSYRDIRPIDVMVEKPDHVLFIRRFLYETS